MTEQQFYLLKMAEEAAELSKECMKAMQFGLWSSGAAGSTNVERISREFVDLMAVTELFQDSVDNGCGEFDIAKVAFMNEDLDDVVQAKKDKVAQYLSISKELGEVS